MSPKPIAIFNINETTRDPRVRRIASPLCDRGNRVMVFGSKSESDVGHAHFEGYEIVRIDIPQSYTDEKTSYVIRYCPEAF